jgi:hypothetical protein
MQGTEHKCQVDSPHGHPNPQHHSIRDRQLFYPFKPAIGKVDVFHWHITILQLVDIHLKLHLSKSFHLIDTHFLNTNRIDRCPFEDPSRFNPCSPIGSHCTANKWPSQTAKPFHSSHMHVHHWITEKQSLSAASEQADLFFGSMWTCVSIEVLIHLIIAALLLLGEDKLLEVVTVTTQQHRSWWKLLIVIGLVTSDI